MMRRNDWQSRLFALIRQRASAPFAHGTNDCCMFAADCVVAMCDEDPARDYRGTYGTEAGAAVAVAKAGGLRAIARAAFGDEITATLARVGDVGLIEHSGNVQALAVYDGLRWLAPGEFGLARVDACLHAWRIG